MLAFVPFLLPVLALSLPHPFDDGLSKRCGPVSQFFRPTEADWTTARTDDFLNTWWTDHASEFDGHARDFSAAYGQWALGNPGWTCEINGADDDCDVNECDSRVLNDKGDQIQVAYYVVLGIRNLHTYFTGLRDSFEVSAIAAALAKDSFATTFYKDKDDKQVTALKEILNAVAMVVGIGAAAAGLGDGPEGAIASGISAIFSGAVGAVNPLLVDHKDDTFQKASDLGSILSTIVIGSIKEFISANDQLMAGGIYQNTGDIRTYLSGGAWVDSPHGVDEVNVIGVMDNFLIGNAINQLYRQQKIFIMGGGQCSDGQDIGSGPQNYSLCRDGKAWYLYYWQENNVISTTSHQWGWVATPPGADQIGKDGTDYAGIKVQDIIASSLDAYNVAGYNYGPDTAAQRAQSAIRDGWRNPGAQGPSWEGTFTIPVCDVGWAVGSNLERKEWLLQPYGHDSRPNWCGAICGNDVQKTKDFIHAVNMDGFQSPKHLCSDGSAPY